ncbi:MAG: hypothetical protein JRH11_09485 [Deltaproteobacteria bacterium]|nr:hypothetical protein [Deltaproteobacteria bacterium]
MGTEEDTGISSAEALLASLMGDVEEPVRMSSPMDRHIASLEALLEDWEKREVVEFEPDADRRLLAEKLFEFVGKRAGRNRGLSGIGDWLCERGAVADVFATDDELEADLRK